MALILACGMGAFYCLFIGGVVYFVLDSFTMSFYSGKVSMAKVKNNRVRRGLRGTKNT